MPRTYVDNAYNRSCGRVGMAHGTAVMSRSSGGSSSYSGGGGGGRTYVDNSMNRSLGRVGLELGTAAHSSRSNSNSYTASGSSRTYVDNASNRDLGRVGLPHGSAVNSSNSSHSTGTYVDNSANRAIGRVGLPLGSAVVHSTTGSSSASRRPLGLSSTSGAGSVGAGCYVDNAYNQRLGRVGLPYGTAVVSKNSTFSTPGSAGGGGQRRYVDNPMNRKLGRVGKVVGTAPVSSSTSTRGPRCPTGLDEAFQPLIRIDPEDNNLGDIMRQLQCLREELLNRDNHDPIREHNFEAAIGIVNRHEASLARYRAGLQMPDWIRGGEIIDFKDIQLGEKLGSGGFGDVHVGIWKRNSQVAVKKLRVQRVSQQKKEDFQKEVKMLSSLSHPCIIKFFGACIVSPNLAIVMEFMGAGSLYDVLHVEIRSLGFDQKSQMVVDMLSALKYMHERSMAHRDIKSMNVMVCDDYAHCKLADFGLALKEEARSSASVADHSVVGTLIYSPPEVIAGRRLTITGLMSADIYSMTIVIIELLTGRKPYDGMNQHQVRAAISNLEGPSLTSLIGWSEEIKGLLKTGMSPHIDRRPSAVEMFNNWSSLTVSNQLGRLTLSDPTDNGQSTSGIPTPPLSRELSHNSTARVSSRYSTTSGATTPVVTASSSGSSTASTRRFRCPVCLDQTIGYAFSCGHLTCENCYLRLLRHPTLCPICRSPTTNATRLFLP